jgi:hypothetical protein
MGQIILKIDELVAQKWDTLSLEQKERLTWQFEELVLQLFSDTEKSDSMKKTISEPSTTYKATAKKGREKNDISKSQETPLTKEEQELRVQKVREFFKNFSADFTGYKFDRDEANER